MQILSLALELFEEALVDLIFLEVVDVVLEEPDLESIFMNYYEH